MSINKYLTTPTQLNRIYAILSQIAETEAMATVASDIGQTALVQDGHIMLIQIHGHHLPNALHLSLWLARSGCINQELSAYQCFQTLLTIPFSVLVSQTNIWLKLTLHTMQKMRMTMVIAKAVVIILFSLVVRQAEAEV